MGRDFVLGKSTSHGIRNLLLGTLYRANTTEYPFFLGKIVLFNDPRGIARDDGIRRNAARHHRIRSHHGMSSDDQFTLLANNRGAETNPALFFDPDGPASRLWSADCGICSPFHIAAMIDH